MEIHKDIPLAPYTTFKVGGKADYFCAIKNLDELKQAVEYANDKSLPMFILGGGSNLLVSDSGFRGLAIKIDLKGIEFEEIGDGAVLAHVSAGEVWDNFVKQCVRRGLYGTENLSGIPGLVGATPMQNVGAYGADVSGLIDYVRAFDLSSRKLKVFTNQECGFGYRNSFFKTVEGQNFLIISVTFRLKTSGPVNLSYQDLARYFGKFSVEPSLERIRDAILEIRSNKFPDLMKYGTAGSFFKNPIVSPILFNRLKNIYPEITGFPTEGGIKISAAYLIDKVAGWRGKCVDDVCSFSNQALVIINKGNARANEIKNFTEKLRKDIKLKTDIELEREVRFVGAFD